jgi:S1-C subfamily serine protease
MVLGIVLQGQVRNGWRSIYDKEGRLTRMYYYQNGINNSDSSRFFQYYAENHLKAYVIGEIHTQKGYVDGSVMLFDQAGKLTRFDYGKTGHSFFNVECDYYQECILNWSDRFEVNSGCWVSDSSSVRGSELVVHNSSKPMGIAVYKPKVPVSLENEFVCKLVIPVNNSSKQGLALGWKDEDNYYLIELSFGTYYSVHQFVDGRISNITQGRTEIERPGDEENILIVRKTDKNLIIEWNGVMQNVLPLPDFSGDKIALVSRSRGDMRVSDFAISYKPGTYQSFYKDLWVGKGTGFFIAPNRILTTYDNISEANSLRVHAEIDGKKMILPATVFRIEENNNIAILNVDVPGFKAFDELPFGYGSRAPISETVVFSLGFPNAISSIHVHPEVFQGKIIHGSTFMSGYRLLEMSFRYGMSGAPVFDNDANLVGVCALRGMDIKHSEMIDFNMNSRLFMANMGKFDRSIVSPLKNLSTRDKISKLSELVVILESSVFELE